MDTSTRRRGSAVRKAGWLAVASMLALAALGPGAGVANAGLTAAVYTSNQDGSIVNENIYPSKDDVYLTGGPCPQGGNLPDGQYYFEVVQPKGGGALLSTDAIGLREFTITSGFITAASGHQTHALACDSSAMTIQLMPYNDSANGEYKLVVATAASVEACKGFDATKVFAICQQADQKSDNFKARLDAPAINVVKVADPTTLPVGGGSVTYTYTVTNLGNVALANVTVVDDKCVSPAPAYVSGDANANGLLDTTETWIFTCSMLITADTVNVATATGYDGDVPVTDQDTASVTVLPPTAPPTQAPTATPTAAPTATPTVAPSFSQAVLAETGTPSVTLPPSDMSSNGPTGSDSWRIALVAIAALLASALVMTPAMSRSRR